jgi:DNA-binding MarR family transcriptional regulator
MTSAKTNPVEPDPGAKLGEVVLRELTARTVALHEAIADRLGLSPTELKCLDFAGRAGRPITAGELAALTGLSTGAITGIIDRLEKANFVRREKDPKDRRQVYIRLLPGQARELEALYEPVSRACEALSARYAEHERALIGGFVDACMRAVEREVERLRAGAEAVRSSTTVEGAVQSVPLAALESGVLEFKRGVSDVGIGSVTEALLYRARFGSVVPKVEVSGGSVTIASATSAFKLFGRRERAQIDLHRFIPWAIGIRGGASHVEADLRELELRSFDVRGGASDVSLSLPTPKGTVPVTVRGGVNNLTIVRPAGVATRLLVGHGASDMTIDTLRLGAVGGEMRWETPDFARATDRYDLEIGGGASGLTLTTA